MSSFFNPENKFFSTLGKVFDLLVLSLMWLVFCLPVITIGPASTALYYTMVKVIRRERSYLFKEFFRSFKLNFKQGVIVTLIYVALAALMVIDIDFAIQLTQDGSKVGSILYGVFIAEALFAIFTLVYIFPVLSRFTVTIKHLFKWAFFMSIRHLGWTLLLVVLFVGTAVMMGMSFLYLPPLCILLPGIYTLIASFIIEKVFKRYMPKEEESDEEAGVDRWYNE